jgi:hypothetical protein
VVAAIVVACAHVANEWVLDGDVEQFDATGEGNAPSWASTVATFAAALAAALLAAQEPQRRRRRVWLALAAAMAFLSLDDGAALHESVSDDSLMQIVVLLPVTGLVFVGLWRLSGDRAVRAGLLVLVAAVAVEQAGGRVTRRLEDEGTGWPDVLRNALEESLELLGWGVIAAALCGAVTSARAAPR